MVEKTKLLRCLHVGEEDQPTWSKEKVLSIGSFGVEISQVLEVPG